MDKQNIHSVTFSSDEKSPADMACFHLILFSSSDEMHSLWLPMVPEGFFRFSDRYEHRFLSIIAKNGQWVAVCKKPTFFANVPIDKSCEMPLEDGQLLNIEFEDTLYTLYVEKVSQKQMTYHNYTVCSDTEIGIGSQPGNDICFDSPYVSRNHAVLTRSNGQWSIRDCGSTYGVYVNRKRQDFANLCIGDTIFIMGLRLIVGPNFFSINDGIGSVKIDHSTLQKQLSGIGGYSRYFGQDFDENTEHFFNRAPRKRTDVKQQIITVEGPPMSMNQNKMPLMLRMGSSLVMGGTAALAGNFTTLLSSVLFPFITSKYSDKQRHEYEQLRTTKYTEYLEQKRVEIENACREEKDVLDRRYPSIQQIIDIALQKQHLWERRPVDTDFLQLRLGTGTLPLSAEISYPPKRFELETDELEEMMYELVEAPHNVEDAPMVLSLTETVFCGLIGARQPIIDFIRQMILQIAVLHSYDEVKMVFLLSKSDLDQLDPIRYLPHTWDDQRSIRFIATNEAEAYRLGEYIQGRIESEKESSSQSDDLQKILKKHPYYVVFALDKKLVESHEVLKTIQGSEGNNGVSIITAYDDLPKESQKIITLESPQVNTCTTMSVNGGDNMLFRLDPVSNEDISKAMHTLANISLKTVSQTHTIPKMVTFLEMFNTGRIEQLNPLKRWRDNNPVKSLAAPVGVTADGSLFMLDLHEKHQGPHGLVAGMTGSGKSEFIITYILSMAVNYHPDEVAFVLIDYKGGGLADAFENPRTGIRLPHLAGTITNLDGASIQRSLMSIESELVRRQKVFSDVGKSFDEGSMNIYTYQKLYRAGKVSDPMPHLFIISDEFAELKQQQPEFMEKLISAARIGRSLGVHLILATQKPSGVVNDQIRSNTKFRVCLRVQDRSDSMDMLKRPEAAELKDTGRFYLQVGYNEYFAMGQSAWCGAQYEPQDTAPVQRDDAIEFLDITGQIITNAKPQVKKTDSGMKQIGAVVKYLSDLAKRESIQTRQLWLPELPKILDLDELSQHNQDIYDQQMSIPLGLLDDPVNQTQFPLSVDFETCQNILICGNNGSGKTALLQSILYLLSQRLTPEDLNFYILDYSSRTLNVFKRLPHCGAILQEEDENSLDEFFNIINNIIAERKRLFSSLEVESFDAARKIKRIPLILVIIDNIAILSTSSAGETHSYKLSTYLKGSATYGVKFIITSNHLGEVSSRVRQELSMRIGLHMKDKYEYSDLLGGKVGFLPSEAPGKGLYKWNEVPLEFQAGIIGAEVNAKSRILLIKEVVDNYCSNSFSRASAQQLQVYSETIDYDEFARQFKPGRIPLGYSKREEKPVALPLKQFSLLSLYFGKDQGRKPILNNFLLAAQNENMELWIIKRKKNSIFDNPEDGIDPKQLKNSDFLTCTTENLRLLQSALVSEINRRHEFIQAYCSERGIIYDQENIASHVFPALQQNTTPIFLLFESIADVCETISSIAAMSYREILHKARLKNIYIVGCFDADTPQEVSCNSLFATFSKGEVLLFGGQFDKQSLLAIPDAFKSIKQLPYNVALMQYRNQFHTIVMPCGEIEEATIDEDLQDIF